MGKMKDLLIGETENLSEQTGYSFEFLMDTWYEHQDEMPWEQFRAAALRREWMEVNPLADVVWMITVSPDCKRPVVRCAEMEKPYSFAITIMDNEFTGLPGLVANALKQLEALRRAAKKSSAVAVH